MYIGLLKPELILEEVMQFILMEIILMVKQEISGGITIGVMQVLLHSIIILMQDHILLQFMVNIFSNFIYNLGSEDCCDGGLDMIFQRTPYKTEIMTSVFFNFY